MTQISIPIHYEVVGTPPRKRKPETMRFKEMISVNVKDVDLADAPVGAILHYEGCSDEVRYYDGKWWVADSAPSLKIGELRSLAMLNGTHKSERYFNNGLMTSYHLGYTIDEFNSKSDDRFHPHTEIEAFFSRVEWSKRRSKIENVMQHIDDKMVSIGGKLFTRVEEPTFFVSCYRDIVTKSVCFGKNKIYIGKNSASFPMNDEEGADLMIEEICKGSDLECKVFVEAEYFYGDVKPADNPRRRFIKSAEEAIRNIGERLQDTNKDCAIAWFDANAIFEEFNKLDDENGEEADALLSALSEPFSTLIESAKTAYHKSESLQRSSFISLDNLMDFEMANYLWKTRPISCDQSFGFSL